MEELKHDPIPGYPRAFLIAFAIMGIYLALILITSPGPAKKHGHNDDHAESHGHTEKAVDEKDHH